jgi:hypothetical protein
MESAGSAPKPGGLSALRIHCAVSLSDSSIFNKYQNLLGWHFKLRIINSRQFSERIQNDAI